jgi:hypothetical protein
LIKSRKALRTLAETEAIAPHRNVWAIRCSLPTRALGCEAGETPEVGHEAPILLMYDIACGGQFVAEVHVGGFCSVANGVRM